MIAIFILPFTCWNVNHLVYCARVMARKMILERIALVGVLFYIFCLNLMHQDCSVLALILYSISMRTLPLPYSRDPQSGFEDFSIRFYYFKLFRYTSF